MIISFNIIYNFKVFCFTRDLLLCHCTLQIGQIICSNSVTEITSEKSSIFCEKFVKSLCMYMPPNTKVLLP